MKKIIPGLLIRLSLAVIAIAVSRLPFPPFTISGPAPHPLEPLIIAIILGIITNNLLRLPLFFEAGIDFSAKKLLSIAIILMGARIQSPQLWQISSVSLFINIICVVAALIIAVIIGRWLSMPRKSATLIGVGTAICGSSAIIACAPIIAASQSEITLAIGTVNLFGTIAIFVFPLLGKWLHLSMIQFGVFAGTSIQAIPQVIAGGFAYGVVAGKVATIVKLVRVILLVPTMLTLALAQRKHQSQLGKQPWYNYVPPMIIGFIILVILNSIGIFEPFTVFSYPITPLPWLINLSDFLIVTTMAGIGLSTSLKEMTSGSLKALSMGFFTMLFLMIVNLMLIYFFIT